MSHAFGSLCETHDWVMAPGFCPECPEDHGFTYVPCEPRCPNYEKQDESEEPD